MKNYFDRRKTCIKLKIMVCKKKIKYLKYLFFFLFFVVIRFDLYSQYDILDFKKDSIIKIETALLTEKNQKVKADYYTTLLRYYFLFDYGKTPQLIDSLDYYSKKTNYQPGLIYLSYAKGESEKSYGNISRAIQYFNNGIELAKQNKNDTLLAYGYMSAGLMLIEFAQFNNSLNYLLKSLSMYRKLNSNKGIALSNLYLGRLFFWYNDLDAALEYYTNVQSISFKNNFIPLFSLSLIFKGEAYLKYKNFDSSQYYLNFAINLGNQYNEKYIEFLAKRFLISYYFSKNHLDSAIQLGLNSVKELNDSRLMYFKGDYFTLISHCYQTKGNLDSALFYNLEALNSRRQNNLKLLSASSFVNVGDSYLRLKKYKEAIRYIDSGIKISINTGKYLYTTSAYKKLSQAYEGLNDIHNSFLALKKYIYFRDIYEKEQNTKEFAILSTQLELEKSKVELNKVTLENQKSIIYLVSIVAMLFIIITVITFLFFIRKRKDNILLTIQKNEINNTLSLLEESQDKLKRLNEELEKRVEERTVDLKAEINNRIIAEEKLIQSKEKISDAYKKEKELNQLKSDLINMLSHEYRTPLTVISSSVDLLKLFDRVNAPEKFNRQVDKIIQSVSRMTTLLDNVFTFGKIKSSQDNLILSEIDIVHYLKNLTNEQNDINKGNLNISLFSNYDSIYLLADESMLWHIFTNLISNSIKYSGDSQIIEVWVLKNSDSIKISFKDYGIGIPQTDISHIFEPFFRSSNTGFIQGTGFGLSIVKNYVELLNGEMQVNSKLNEGTEVILNFFRN